MITLVNFNIIATQAKLPSFFLFINELQLHNNKFQLFRYTLVRFDLSMMKCLEPYIFGLLCFVMHIY